MKPLLKFLKWLGITLLSIFLLLAIFLGIVGLPKPPSMHAENVPRLPFSVLNSAVNASGDFGNFIRLIGWSRTSDEGIYVQVPDGFALKFALLEKPGAPPKIMDSWPTGRSAGPIVFHPDPDMGYFLYRKDNTRGRERYQLYRFDMKTKETTMLTNGEDRYGTPRFTPDGEHIIYTRVQDGNVAPDLYIMNPDDAANERLLLEDDTTDVDNGFRIDDFSPDGSKVIIRMGSDATSHHILDIEKGTLTSLESDTTIEARYSYHEWSKDGNRIYYPSTRQAEFTQLRVRYLNTGIDSALVGDINGDISNVNESPDGNWLAFTAWEEGYKWLYIHHIDSGRTERLNDLPLGRVLYTTFHPKKDATLAFPLQYYSLQTDIFSYNIENQELIRWTDNKVESDYPDPIMITYPTFDIDSLTGKTREISAVFHKPKTESEKPYPVIIDIHGGPEGQSLPEFNLLDQMYLDKGYVILKPNVRGSTGYGFTFVELDDGLLRENAVKDIGALLDWIENNPELDATKVIVRGGSYGGYMSLASAIHYSNRLLGAINYNGITDFETMLEGPVRNADRTVEYGDINDPKMRRFLSSISPVNNVEQITIPVFIYQSEQDVRVPVSQSRKMVEALEKHNKDYWYLEAANEGHVNRSGWNGFYGLAAEMEFIDRIFEDVDESGM